MGSSPAARISVAAALFSLLLIDAGSVVADDEPGAGLRSPPRSFALPTEIEHDFGADNGEATIVRLLPLYSFPLTEQLRLVNVDIISLADSPGGVPGRPGNPNPIAGDQEFGLSDWVHASFFTPENQSGFIWGAGFIVSVPTATNDVLGTGKWAAGPALRLTWRDGPWNVGMLAGQRWSFAGDASRPDLNSLIMRGTIRRQLPNRWYFVSAPIITVNWDARSSQRWLVPVGGGFGRSFDLWQQGWAASVQAYYNVIRPDGAPDWAIRLQLVAALPF
jgi:hypothetical protein